MPTPKEAVFGHRNSQTCLQAGPSPSGRGAGPAIAPNHIHKLCGSIVSGYDGGQAHSNASTCHFGPWWPYPRTAWPQNDRQKRISGHFWHISGPGSFAKSSDPPVGRVLMCKLRLAPTGDPHHSEPLTNESRAFWESASTDALRWPPGSPWGPNRPPKSPPVATRTPTRTPPAQCARCRDGLPLLGTHPPRYLPP